MSPVTAVPEEATEKSEEEGKARDAEETPSSGNGNGKSVSERAAEEKPDVPPPPPLQADKQLSLGGLGRRGVPIESRVSIRSASVETEGLFDPEVEGTVLMAYEPFGYDYKPKRKNGKIVGWKLIQDLRPTSVVKVPPAAEEAIRAILEEHQLVPTPA